MPPVLKAAHIAVLVRSHTWILCNGPIVQGDCPPGNQILVTDDNTKTIGQGTVTFGWVCNPGT